MGSEDNSVIWRLAERTARAALGAGGNAVYSPACIYEGLDLLRLGADGATRDELDGIIGGGGDINLGIECAGDGAFDDYVARVASGVWVDEAADPSAGFLESCALKDVPVARADFTAPGAGGEISRWVSDATDGLVAPEVELDPRTLACVVSALYLRDAWEEKFPKEATGRGPFHAEGGDVEADFMVKEAGLPIADSDFGTLVGYPLSGGATVVFALPMEGVALSDVVADGSAVRAMSGFSAPSSAVELHLPKFTCETDSVDMEAVLAEAGFSSAGSPSLLPMTGARDVIASFAHGAKVAVDEDGLEAGAYYRQVLPTGPYDDREPPAPRIVVLDRPFLFAIVSRTGQPLFVGAVTCPEADPMAWVPHDADKKAVGDDFWIYEDMEIPGVCRVAMEATVVEDGVVEHGWDITCHAYSHMEVSVHVHGFQDALKAYRDMKRELGRYAARLGDEGFDPGGWCDGFAARWQAIGEQPSQTSGGSGGEDSARSGRQYGKANNVKLDTWMPGRCEYVFADLPSHRADALFIRSEVPVRFRRKEMVKDGAGYVLVFCHFRKRYEGRFLECMADLERAMIIEGHGDYPAFCDEVIAPLLEEC